MYHKCKIFTGNKFCGRTVTEHQQLSYLFENLFMQCTFVIIFLQESFCFVSKDGWQWPRFVWQQTVCLWTITWWQWWDKTHPVARDTTAQQWQKWRHDCWRIAVVRKDAIVEYLPHCVAKRSILWVIHGVHFVDCIFVVLLIVPANIAKTFPLQKGF